MKIPVIDVTHINALLRDALVEIQSVAMLRTESTARR